MKRFMALKQLLRTRFRFFVIDDLENYEFTIKEKIKSNSK